MEKEEESNLQIISLNNNNNHCTNNLFPLIWSQETLFHWLKENQLDQFLSYFNLKQINSKAKFLSISGNELINESFKEEEVEHFLNCREKLVKADFENIYIDSTSLQYVRELCKGTLGTIYRASKDVTVILKSLVNSQSLYSFREDLLHCFDLSHPNLLACHGLTFLYHNPYLVVELAEGGSLHQYLQKCKSDLDASTLSSLALQIASGMEYLHCQGIIHSNFTLYNILVSAGNQIKLYDFGLKNKIRMQLFNVDFNTLINEQLQWISPEILREVENETKEKDSIFNVFTFSSNVYSFGIILWQIFSLGKLLFTDNQFTLQKIKSSILDGIQLDKPSLCPDSIYEIVKSCCQFNPEARDTFNSLKAKLEILNQDIEANARKDRLLSRLSTPVTFNKFLGFRRVKKELFNFVNAPPHNITFVETIGDNLTAWRVKLEFSERPHAGKTFYVSINLPNDYPFKPPKMALESRILHPNFQQNGRFCCVICADDWSPQKTILMWIQKLYNVIQEPQDSCILNTEMNQLYKRDKEEYYKKIEENAF